MIWKSFFETNLITFIFILQIEESYQILRTDLDNEENDDLVAGVDRHYCWTPCPDSQLLYTVTHLFFHLSLSHVFTVRKWFNTLYLFGSHLNKSYQMPSLEQPTLDCIVKVLKILYWPSLKGDYKTHIIQNIYSKHGQILWKHY